MVLWKWMKLPQTAERARFSAGWHPFWWCWGEESNLDLLSQLTILMVWAGKWYILVFSWVERAMLKQVVKWGIIWSDFYNYCMKRPWQCHRAVQGRAGQDSAVLRPVLFIPWVWPPSVPGEFIYSAKSNAAYKLWFLNSYLAQTLFFGSRSMYPPTYQVIHPNVLQTLYIKHFKQCLIISPASPTV